MSKPFLVPSYRRHSRLATLSHTAPSLPNAQVLAKMQNSHLDLLQLLKNDLLSAGAPTHALSLLEQAHDDAAKRRPDFFLVPQNYEGATKAGLERFSRAIDGLGDATIWRDVVASDPAEAAKRMRSTATLCAAVPSCESPRRRARLSPYDCVCCRLPLYLFTTVAPSRSRFALCGAGARA